MKVSRSIFFTSAHALFYFSKIFRRIKINVSSKTLGSLASIEIVSPLASPWLPFVRIQLEANACNEVEFNAFAHALFYFSKIYPQIKINFSYKTVGFLASIKTHCFTYGLPLASFCWKPTGSQAIFDSGPEISRPTLLHLHMQFLIFFSPLKICFLFKTLGFLASTEIYCFTFGLPLASHCCKRIGAKVACCFVVSNITIFRSQVLLFSHDQPQLDLFRVSLH